MTLVEVAGGLGLVSTVLGILSWGAKVSDRLQKTQMVSIERGLRIQSLEARMSQEERTTEALEGKYLDIQLFLAEQLGYPKGKNR